MNASLLFVLLLLLLLLLLLAAADAADAARLSPPPPSSSSSSWRPLNKTALERAFAADSFRVVRWIEYEGMRGALAESLVATTLSTGAPKLAYYAEGSGYQMGRLIGTLGAAAAQRMANAYRDNFILQLIAPAWDAAHGNTTLGRDLKRLLNYLFLDGSVESMRRQLAAGDIFPAALVDEMRGVADGATAAGAVNVTLDRVMSLNYGFDFLSAFAYSGDLSARLAAGARRATHTRALRPPLAADTLRTLDDAARAARAGRTHPTMRGALRELAQCDALGVERNGAAPVLARDFMLVTCDVLQEVVAFQLLNPSDGRVPVLSASPPGIVGSIVAMNAAGVAMGVDTIRSAAAGVPAVDNASSLRRGDVGLNSVLLIRHTLDTSSNVSAAVDCVVDAPRGCPWLHPMCGRARADDATSGACFVLEAARSFAHGATVADFRAQQYPGVLLRLENLVPDAHFLAEHACGADVFRRGVFVRSSAYAQQTAFLTTYNARLWAHAGLGEYNATAFGSDGIVWHEYARENAAKKALKSNYFPPLRGALWQPSTSAHGVAGYVVVSNDAVVPENRMSQMFVFDEVLEMTAESPQFRYDRLEQQIQAFPSDRPFTADDAQTIIDFLAPSRLPGFWHHYLHPGVPSSAQIEGLQAVADLETLTMRLHVGYYADKWYQVSLANYV